MLDPIAIVERKTLPEYLLPVVCRKPLQDSASVSSLFARHAASSDLVELRFYSNHIRDCYGISGTLPRHNVLFLSLAAIEIEKVQASGKEWRRLCRGRCAHVYRQQSKLATVCRAGAGCRLVGAGCG